MENISPPSIEKIKLLNKIKTDPLLGIFYGSQSPKSDKDIFLIYPMEVDKGIFLENYDLNQISADNFKYKLFHRDIEYTEPILTGQYIFGNKKIIDESLDFLNNQKPSEIIYDYLNKRSIETYLQAENYYSTGKLYLFNDLISSNIKSQEITKKLINKNQQIKSPIINRSLGILTYSLSYLASINRYKLGKNHITIQEIASNPINKLEEEFVDLRNYFKRCSNEKISSSLEEIDNYFLKTKQFLKQGVNN